MQTFNSSLMMLAGCLFLLLLTGGNASILPEVPDNNQTSNYSFEEASGGNASFLQKIPGYNQTSNDSIVETSGNNIMGYRDEYGRYYRNRPRDWGENHANCSYDALINYLNLTKSKSQYTLSRPVRYYNDTTYVYIRMQVAAILDLRESDQTLISYIWFYMYWRNQYIRWNKKDFCGLRRIEVPTNLVWKPDITIKEMTEKDKAPPSPFLLIYFYGDVDYFNDQVVHSTCKMDVYKFPFDIQRCNISFRSLIHDDQAIRLRSYKDTKYITEMSKKMMHTQYEWLFLNMTAGETTQDYYIGRNQTTMFYTIVLQRRSVLYIANFLLPTLFFLCLDIASFLISEAGGEKLSFKVTVMLAVTVMQLILNEILPSSSDQVPLIAVYCIGIFSLMMLSLLETILVMHLLEKDADRDNQDKHSCFKVMKKCGNCVSISDASDDQTSSVAKEGSSGQLTEVSFVLREVSDELKQIEKTMTDLSNRNDKEEPGYWTRVAQRINRIFIIFYVTAVVVFFAIIFPLWTKGEVVDTESETY